MKFKIGERVRCVGNNCGHGHLVIGKIYCVSKVIEKKNGILVENPQDKAQHVSYYDVHHFEKIKEDSMKTDVMNYKDLIAKKACSEGVDWFIGEFGNKDVRIKEVYKKVRDYRREWTQWLDGNGFKEEEERTYQCGDCFEWKGERHVVVRASHDTLGDNMAVVMARFKDFYTTRYGLLKVNDLSKITAEELQLDSGVEYIGRAKITVEK